MLVAETLNNHGYKYAPEVGLGVFLSSCLIAHPLFLLGMRV